MVCISVVINIRLTIVIFFFIESEYLSKSTLNATGHLEAAVSDCSGHAHTRMMLLK